MNVAEPHRDRCSTKSGSLPPAKWLLRPRCQRYDAGRVHPVAPTAVPLRQIESCSDGSGFGDREYDRRLPPGGTFCRPEGPISAAIGVLSVADSQIPNVRCSEGILPTNQLSERI